MDAAHIARMIANGPMPRMPFVAALPMYDWQEAREEVDSQWAAIRAELRSHGVDAPERLARRNSDLPAVPGGIRNGAGIVIAPDPATLPPDTFHLAALWQHPNLLLAQTCHGPLELWLRGVRVVGQEDYSRIDGGEGEDYSSALVMRRGLPPSGSLAAVFPTKGRDSTRPTFPLVAEGGSLPIQILTGLRFAYNASDSMSGYLALKRDLEANGNGLHIFKGLTATGSHRASIRSVAAGLADIAAVDAKTWALAQRFEPAARELAVVGCTGRRRGLPFIAVDSR